MGFLRRLLGHVVNFMRRLAKGGPRNRYEEILFTALGQAAEAYRSEA